MPLWDTDDLRKIAFGQISPRGPVDTAKQVGLLCKIGTWQVAGIDGLMGRERPSYFIENKALWVF
jgi:hypothetical protein